MSIYSRLRQRFSKSSVAAMILPARTRGWVNYGHSGPAVPLTVASQVYALTNDSAAFQDTRFALAGTEGLWDVPSQRFNFSSLEIGDIVVIDCVVGINNTAGSTQKSVGLQMRARLGEPSEYTEQANPVPFKSTGDQGFYSFRIAVTIDDSVMQGTPALVEAFCDETGVEVQLYSFKAYITRTVPTL